MGVSFLRSWMRAPALAALAAGLVSTPGCTTTEEVPDDSGEGTEAEGALGVPLTEPDETDAPTRTAPQPLDAAKVTELVDLRGMGDSGWANTHESTPRSAAFGAALDRFDASGVGYRGHVSYLNWETVVGEGCARFANEYSPGKSYAFVSRPENLAQAMDRGFHLVGLSNNHSRDCADPDGEGLTARAVASVARSGVGFHGVGPDAAKKNRPVVVTVKAAGRDVRVAFGSIYFGSRRSCDLSVCASDKRALFEGLRDADADLRVVAMHSMDGGTQDELVRAGIEFVRDYGGDVVYGSGPHVWKGVRVVQKARGGKGVVFESVGNFLHPSLAAQSKNFIGRALFDKGSLELRQVQILPVANAGTEMRYSSADPTTLASNLRWTGADRGYYANVKR